MPASLCREEKSYNDNDLVNSYCDQANYSQYDDMFFTEIPKKKKHKKIKNRIKKQAHDLKEINERVEVIINTVSNLKKKTKANETTIEGIDYRLKKMEKLVEVLAKDWLDSAEDTQTYKNRIETIFNHWEVKIL